MLTSAHPAHAAHLDLGTDSHHTISTIERGYAGGVEWAKWVRDGEEVVPATPIDFGAHDGLLIAFAALLIALLLSMGA